MKNLKKIDTAQLELIFYTFFRDVCFFLAFIVLLGYNI